MEYIDYRRDYYFEYAPEWFFVTGMSVSKKTMVGPQYFWRMFKLNGFDITPSRLRSAMMSFYRHDAGLDYFQLSSISGIKPRATVFY